MAPPQQFVGDAEPELGTFRTNRTEPALGETNRADGSGFQNYLTDVALLMNSVTMFIGLAGFESDGHTADAAHVLGGACHGGTSMRTTAEHAITRTGDVQFGDQLTSPMQIPF